LPYPLNIQLCTTYTFKYTYILISPPAIHNTIHLTYQIKSSLLNADVSEDEKRTGENMLSEDSFNMASLLGIDNE